MKQLSHEDVLKLLPDRIKTAHKGDFGKLLLICGSQNCTGAPALASMGALRCGAGLVYLAVPFCIHAVEAVKLTEPVFFPLPCNDGMLSQGEKQKVLIGRALISNPEILIFDEAYNGLDIFAKKDLSEIITKLARDSKKTLIFVTHNTEEILPIFNKALLLKDGKIHSQGDLQEVIVQENLEDFYGNEVDVFQHGEKFFILAK